MNIKIITKSNKREICRVQMSLIINYGVNKKSLRNKIYVFQLKLHTRGESGKLRKRKEIVVGKFGYIKRHCKTKITQRSKKGKQNRMPSNENYKITKKKM